MPRPRFQYSLLGLFVLTTVIAGVLGWWFSRPPRFVTSSVHTSVLICDADHSETRRTAVHYDKRAWLFDTPHGERRVERTFIVIAPSPLGIRILPHERPGQEGWQCDFGYDIRVSESLKYHFPNVPYPILAGPGQVQEFATQEGYKSNLAAVLKLTYDARANAVTFGDQTVPVLEDAIYVIHIDEHWQPRLYAADAQFKIPNVRERVLAELRKLHQMVLQKPWKIGG